LLPFAPNVFDYFACCDVVVFPSVEPHFARPVIEAAAMSRPVVASDIGGVRELVENGKTGLLVPPNKKVLLASAIISILDNPKVANQFGLFGKERAVELYSATKNVKMIARMYTDIKDR
jgi:glycosyltransferase involved in cell wall biosynthesis